MNHQELKTIIRRFARINPVFFDWAEKQARRMSEVNGTSVDEEWDEQQQTWLRTLENVTIDEAQETLNRIEVCQLEVPQYGEIIRTLKIEAEKTREARAVEERLEQSHSYQPRYQCPVCRDTGMVRAWNPEFVRRYQREFQQVRRVKSGQVSRRLQELAEKYQLPENLIGYEYQPKDWLRRASLWWRDEILANGWDCTEMVSYLVRCNCDCQASRRFAEEYGLYLARTRRTQRGPVYGPPACGAAVYDPMVMPIRTCFPHEDLSKWYGIMSDVQENSIMSARAMRRDGNAVCNRSDTKQPQFH